MRTIKFTEDFATKKSGESWKCDSQLASSLVNKRKVAVYDDEPAKDAPKKAPAKKAPEKKPAAKSAKKTTESK